MLAHFPSIRKAATSVPSIVLFSASAALATPQGPLSQDVYIKSASPEASDAFGHDVVAFGDLVAFSAPAEDSASTGVGGSPFNNGATDSGAVYVYRFVGGAWVQEAYIKASNTGPDDRFGASIALGPDLLVVGAPGESSSSTVINAGGDLNDASGAGAAYVFRFDLATSSWSQEAYLKASNANPGDSFGEAVAISVDPNVGDAYVLVGAPNEDSGSQLEPQSNASFDAGAAYLFHSPAAGAWIEASYIKPDGIDAEDAFGTAVDIAAPREPGTVGWLLVGAPTEDGGSTGLNGDPFDNSRPNAGAAYLFTVTNVNNVMPLNYLKGHNTGTGDQFGSSVSIDGFATDLLTMAVGAPFEDSSTGGVNPPNPDDSLVSAGAAYLFTTGFQGLLQSAYLKASTPGGFDFFGISVDVQSGRILVGANGEASSATGINGNETSNSAGFSGAAYLYERAFQTSWFQSAYIKSSNSQAQDRFGSGVAMTDRWLVVGARGEDSSSPGVGASQGSNDAPAAGAGYAFRLGDGPFLNYCTGTPNSTLVPGVISGSGSGLLSQNDVVLTASSLPPFSFGFFIVSSQRDFVVFPAGSQGILCLGGSIGRYVAPGQIQNSGAAGEFSIPVDANSIPQPLGPLGVMPGDEFHFQAWHRDQAGGMPTSNFTGGITVLFR